MKKTYLITWFIVFAITLHAQDSLYKITGQYQSLPLKTFIAEVEQKYPVRIFYDEKTIADIFVTAEFNETPLEECLKSILARESVQLYVLGNNQFVIYTGLPLEKLFLAKEQEKKKEEAVRLAEKVSLERLKQLQYQIFNIGIPGKQQRFRVISEIMIRVIRSPEQTYTSLKQNGA